MLRLSLLSAFAAILVSFVQPAAAMDIVELYQSKTIVTGQGEKNRKFGFRDCLDRVLVRVSGDSRLPDLTPMAALRDRAGDFVDSFSYRDRLAGKPIHDEQGTYDRPHDLTCWYRPDIIDPLLAQLGSRPWLGDRPKLTILLDVDRGATAYDVARDSDRDLAMRQAFDQAAEPLAFSVDFPTTAQVGDLLAGSKHSRLGDLEPQDIPPTMSTPVFGHLVWSDKGLGWVATWRFQPRSEPVQWTVRGVNFDEAFRVAVGGVAQILSGNGNPAVSVSAPD